MEAIPGEITAIIQEDTRNYTLVEILSKLMEEQLNKFSDVLFWEFSEKFLEPFIVKSVKLFLELFLEKIQVEL